MTDTPITSNPTPSYIFAVLLRHKKKAFLFFGLTLALVVAVLVWAPRKYASEAKLFVRIGHESVALDPTATTGATVGMSVSRRHEINSVLEVLRSRVMAEKVVDLISPEVILAPGESNWLLDLKTQAVGQLRALIARLKEPGDSTGTAQPREAAVAAVLGMVSAEAPKESNIISITCKARSSEFAQKLVATLVHTYVAEHARYNRTAGSEQFFENQSELMGQQLRATSRELTDLKNEKGIVSIEAQLEFLETQKMEIEAERLRVSRDIASTQASAKTLDRGLKSLDKLVLTTRREDLPNQAADSMRTRLYDLEIREREVSKRFADNNPIVVEVRQQLADVRELFQKENEFRSDSSFEINPNWQEMQMKTFEANTALDGLIKTAESLDRQHAEVVEAIRGLNDDAVRIHELRRQTDLQEVAYRAYRENLEQARIDAELERKQITNVNIVQDATLVSKPVSPQKELVAGLGLFIALCGAVGLALAAEMCDRRLKSVAEVEEATRLPVLIAIPKAREHCVRV